MRLFGQLEAADGGVALAVRGAKQRALLALLALHRGEPVSADRLIDVLWGDGLAAKPANALQAQIGQLRRTLGAGAIVTTEAGYALAVGPDEVDVVRFEQLVAKGRRLAEAGEMAQASAALGEALGLRRGEPLAEFAYAGFAEAERAQLDELTLVAIETRAGADLVLGRHGELAGELEAQLPAAPAARAAVGAAHPRPVPGRTAGRRPARLHRSPRPPGRRAGHRPRAGVAGTPGPDTGPGSVARRSQPGSGPGGRAGGSRQSAGAAEQLHRPRRRAGTAASGRSAPAGW